MKTVGIIAEYNPFHGGHHYQIRKARELTGAGFVVAAMSGDFVQRGGPAIFDKYTRTAMALEGGADLVLELPVRFATSSAEDFAACGVALLDKLGVVDYLCFGSELGYLDVLEQAADILAAEPDGFREELKKGLAAGISFPRARETALEKTMASSGICDGSGAAGNGKLSGILSSPNNILGIEYLKALKRQKSRIMPMTIRRQGQGYHETALPEHIRDIRNIWSVPGRVMPQCRNCPGAVPQDGAADPGSAYGHFSDSGRTPEDKYPFPSASAIRKACQDAFASGNFSPEIQVPVFPDDLSLLLNARLLELSRQDQDLSVFADVSPELASRISRKLLEFDSFSGRIAQLKTRQFTYTRISRALVHILLGITAEEISLSRSRNYVPYIRVLGFRRSAAELLGRIKHSSAIPLITKTADARNLLPDQRDMDMLQQDFHASHMYQTLVCQKSGKRMGNEYTQSVIVW